MDLIFNKTDKKTRTIWVIMSTVFWYAFAHGYRMTNNLFSHDSLLLILQDDSAWQIALGRVFQPILIFIRGGIVNPWLVSVLAIIWLSIAVWLVTDLLDISSPVHIICTAGIMSANVILTSLNLAFVQCVDFYMLSLMLSVLGVWLIDKDKTHFTIMGTICFTLSVGIYQSYICVALVLILILQYRRAINDNSKRVFFKALIRFMICLLTAGIAYLIIWKLFQRVFGIWTSDSYNGMSEVGKISISTLPGLIFGAYGRFFEFLINPVTYVTLVFREKSLSIILLYVLRMVNVIVCAKLIVNIIIKNVKTRLNIWNYIAQVLIIILLPLAANAVFVLSKGMEHTLMIYAFLFIYVFAIGEEPESGSKIKDRILSVVLPCSVLVIIGSQVIYSNQSYLKNALQEKAMDSLMTRIVNDIEHTKGYIPGETPVAISGGFEYSPAVKDIEGFEDINPYGMGRTLFTYMGNDYAYIKYEMGIPFNGTRVNFEDPQVVAMPVYPAEGSVKYIDDVLVVKVADKY